VRSVCLQIRAFSRDREMCGHPERLVRLASAYEWLSGLFALEAASGRDWAFIESPGEAAAPLIDPVAPVQI
jgi:hypothetical protein